MCSLFPKAILWRLFISCLSSLSRKCVRSIIIVIIIIIIVIIIIIIIIINIIIIIIIIIEWLLFCEFYQCVSSANHYLILSDWSELTHWVKLDVKFVNDLPEFAQR